jgi:hypothetical protein
VHRGDRRNLCRLSRSPLLPRNRALCRVPCCYPLYQWGRAGEESWRKITSIIRNLLFNLLVGSRLSFCALRKGIALLAGSRADRRCGRGGRNRGALFELRAQQTLRLVGFVDDDNFKLGKFVHDYEVLGSRLDGRPLYFATVSIRFWLRRTRWQTGGRRSYQSSPTCIIYPSALFDRRQRHGGSGRSRRRQTRGHPGTGGSVISDGSIILAHRVAARQRKRGKAVNGRPFEAK